MLRDPAMVEPETYSRYSMTIDQEAARVEPSTGTIHVLTFHEIFRKRLKPKERRQLAIAQCALRIIAGLEFRSLRACAREIGCSHQALDNAALRISEHFSSIRKFHVSDATRRKQSEARRRQLAR